MNDKNDDQEFKATDVKQGVNAGVVRYVLGASIAGAVVAIAAAFIFAT